MTDTLPSRLRTNSNRNQRHQQNDYLILLQKLRHLKQIELLENNRRLAREQAGLANVIDEAGEAAAMKIKALTQLILTYYAHLNEGQKRSVEKILSIDKCSESSRVEFAARPRLAANSYCMSIDRVQARERRTRANNYTCEEYADWFKGRGVSDDQRCVIASFLINNQIHYQIFQLTPITIPIKKNG